MSINDVVLLLLEVTDCVFFDLLSRLANQILRFHRVSYDAKIATLNFFSKAGPEFCRQNDIVKLMKDKNYLVASIALQSYIEIYGINKLIENQLRVPTTLDCEVATWRFVKGKIGTKRLVEILTDAPRRHILRSCWRISRLLHAYSRGRKLMAAHPYFNSDSWLNALKQHGKRAIFPMGMDANKE